MVFTRRKGNIITVGLHLCTQMHIMVKMMGPFCRWSVALIIQHLKSTFSPTVFLLLTALFFTCVYNMHEQTGCLRAEESNI